jgi:hypothetical protein
MLHSDKVMHVNHEWIKDVPCKKDNKSKIKIQQNSTFDEFSRVITMCFDLAQRFHQAALLKINFAHTFLF